MSIEDAKLHPLTMGGYHLLHRGAEVFARMQARGIRIDVSYAKLTHEHLGRRILHCREQLLSSPEVGRWQRRYGSRFKLSSGPQLRWLLFDELKLTPPKTVDNEEDGTPSVDEEALSKVDVPFVKLLLQWRNLDSARNRYLKSILEETTPDGFMHPFFKLHTVSSYRSSSSDINFHGIPVRDEELRRLIRRCIIPRKGNVLLENDCQGQEVRVAGEFGLEDLHRHPAVEAGVGPLPPPAPPTRFFP